VTSHAVPAIAKEAGKSAVTGRDHNHPRSGKHFLPLAR